ncbi:hypothetical protein OSB04_000064 [Centaurea solstitialis]|uniref:TF-B3 domain-containing protein n=1 Tax=Centaurea solstitialis TaxID=347529 RepID=A0AA38U7U1_9ASTR|nr:hypothetical protein OSB04_000064 [Centaurea solstitialis]
MGGVVEVVNGGSGSGWVSNGINVGFAGGFQMGMMMVVVIKGSYRLNIIIIINHHLSAVCRRNAAVTPETHQLLLRHPLRQRQQNTLRIPKRFIRGHRKKILLNDVVVIVSDDKVWNFGWMISGDGKLWFQKGWPEFAHHYRIRYGHLLVFKHLGKSVFHVTIFDSTNFDDIDQYDEIEVDNMGLEKGEERSSAKSFKAEYPSYKIVIRPSYTRNWGLIVPLDFMRRYLTCDKDHVTCVLEMSNGRKWGPIECRNYKTFGKLYGDNLKKFYDDNHVGVGDVCVFQLIDEIEKRIPPDFIKHFDQEIPETVTLKDLSGRIWHVDIKQHENGVFLKKGWTKFVNEIKPRLGEVMVFRFDRSSTSFTVRIFGTNAIKKQDQDSKKPLNPVKEEDQESDADSIPIRKSTRPRNKPQKFASQKFA